VHFEIKGYLQNAGCQATSDKNYIGIEDFFA
jgi:hypothetical protein